MALDSLVGNGVLGSRRPVFTLALLVFAGLTAFGCGGGGAGGEGASDVQPPPGSTGRCASGGATAGGTTEESGGGQNSAQENSVQVSVGGDSSSRFVGRICTRFEDTVIRGGVPQEFPLTVTNDGSYPRRVEAVVRKEQGSEGVLDVSVIRSDGRTLASAKAGPGESRARVEWSAADMPVR